MDLMMGSVVSIFKLSNLLMNYGRLVDCLPWIFEEKCPDFYEKSDRITKINSLLTLKSEEKCPDWKKN